MFIGFEMSTNGNILTGLARIGALLRAGDRRRSETAGLTPTQSQILHYLARRGPSRITRIAEELSISQPSASDSATALVRKGHVEKVRDDSDVRASLLRSTPSGNTVVQSQLDWPDALLDAVDALQPDEAAALLRGLTRMIGALQARGQIPIQRMCLSCAHFRQDVHSGADRPHHCAFVDAAFGDASFRLDCNDHVEAGPTARLENWSRFNPQRARE